MSTLELPKETGKGAEYPYFPTKQQLFIFRNRESVSVETMARVLKTTAENVERLAAQMGLDVSQSCNDRYADRGYITLIRNNWHILPYAQLLELLSCTEDELAYTLKEDDFLFCKLGDKPVLEPVVYRPLTEREEEQTAGIAKCIRENFGDFGKRKTAEDFDFIDGKYYADPCVGNVSPMHKVRLSDRWGIADRTGEENTKHFADRFKKEVLDTWQLKLDGNENLIVLSIDTDTNKAAESHTVSITDTQIDISAHDAVGIWRGLEYVRRIMSANGTPSLDEITVRRDTRFDIRFLYSYHALYGDPFSDGCLSSYPDELLRAYSAVGINGVWVQAVLYRLCEFPWDASLSEGWERRIEGLRAFADRAARFGIKVYLYINEPRSMPLSFFDAHPELLGCVEDGFGSLCTSLPEVQRYLHDGIYRVCRAVPQIGGFFTITASENLTNCHSKKDATVCPRCAGIAPYQMYAQVNTVIAQAAHEVDPNIQVIAWDWGWNAAGCDAAEITEALKDSGVRVMCTSEEGVTAEIGGIGTSVIDYSISLTGPGDVAKTYWKECRKRGIKTLAKVQFNNTWECSTVPYIPTFDLILQHMEGIVNSGVDGIMLGWTLGGFPSVTLDMISRYYWEDTVPAGKNSACDIYRETFGDYAATVKKVSGILSDAFKNFPFFVWSAYAGPQQLGPANPLFETATGLQATMTGFPHDDVENWRSIFPREVYEEQFRLLSEGFRRGLDLLKACPVNGNDGYAKRFNELVQITTAITCIFESCYHQIVYIRLRDSLPDLSDAEEQNGVREAIIKTLCAEKDTAKELFEVVLHHSAIGYEAANHYFFNKYSLMEKVICCDHLIQRFCKS